MIECEHLSDCAYFKGNIFNMPITEEMIKNEYCRCNPFQCARYFILKILGNPDIPVLLRPDQTGWARDFIMQNAQSVEEDQLYKRIENYRMLSAARIRKPSVVEMAEAVLNAHTV